MTKLAAWATMLGILAWISFGVSFGFAGDQARILIFYSSTGMGHLSAAQAIEKDIKEKDSTAIVKLQNIRDYKSPIQEKMSTKLFWFVVKNYPDFYTKKFKEHMDEGNQTPSLDEFGGEYQIAPLVRDIDNFKPTAILSTHHGAAQTVSNLRGKGLYRNIKIGWLHTDYFQGYFPRISKQVDKTFLAHPD